MYDQIYNNQSLSMLKNELTGVFGSNFTQDLDKIIKLYDVYDSGAEFVIDGAKGYVASDVRMKNIKGLVDKEARFMFATPPSFYVTNTEGKTSDLQTFIEKVLSKNMFANKTLRAAKDCLIGRRVALFIDFNEKGIVISYAPSLEFVYETDEDDTLIKIIRVYTLTDSFEKSNQKIYKKKYEMVDGECIVTEGMYDGMGGIIGEEQEIQTGLEFIPAFVIVNDGLTGDVLGESEVEALKERESIFSKLSNCDFDSLRKNMNQVKYTTDAQPSSTENLSQAPGAYWDISTDPAAIEAGNQAIVGVLNTDTTYTTALGNTLQRIKTSLYEAIDMPETNSDALKGLITSGKSMKALYWGLMTRCDEKMLVWIEAFKFLAYAIIEGTKVFDSSFKIVQKYMKKKKINLNEDYEITVENNYALLEDVNEEKSQDLTEVQAGTMSRKAYMKKWRGLTDKEIVEEMQQLALEKQMLEDSYFPGSKVIKDDEVEKETAIMEDEE